MASSEQLWFELGVRDNVSKVLDNIFSKTKEIQDNLGRQSDLKPLLENALKIEETYDKIAVALRRIKEARSNTSNPEEVSRLKEMKKQVEDMQKAFKKLEKDNVALSTPGSTSFERLKQGFQLMIEQVGRYTNEINAQARVDEREKAAESRRIEELKAKYNELYRIRKQLQDAVLNAAPGSNTSGVVGMISSISARMGAVTRAISGGHGIPASVSGEDYKRFIEEARARTRELTTETNNYTASLARNENMQRTVSSAISATASQARIAQIKGLSVEYDALTQKIRELHALSNNIAQDRVNMQNGAQPVYTQAKITEELARIQQNYNETLARGNMVERQAAEAKRVAAQNAQNLSQVNRGLASTYREISGAANETNRMVQQMAMQVGTYFSLFGAERLLRSIITIGGQFEVQHVALQNILGDVQEANTLFQQLQGLAVESPKTFQELTTYAKQLSAYQIPANELYDTTKRLADMSSGLGVDMNRLILAYGQVRMAAVLRGQELRQFTEAGIPMVQALADKFTEMNGKLTTTADVFQLISKRAVPFEMVRDVLWDMTSQGGQFYNMQAELADTLYGKWQKLQDQWQIILGHIADGKSSVGSFLKMSVEGLVQITRMFDTLMPTIGMFALGRLGQGIYGWSRNAIQNANGTTAVRNMELTKLKEANRLERERVMYGRELNLQEKELVRHKDKLMANEMRLLLAEGEITERQLMQLTNAGKLNRFEMLKLLYAQGYTKEQIKQIANGNLQLLQGGESMMKRLGSGLMSFIGGWPGIIMTAFGAVWSIMSSFEQKRAELQQKGEAMMDHAQQRVNSLTKTLNSVAADGTVEKKVEALEESLLQLGSTGQAIVARSREHMDDINKRWEVLKSGAEGYKRVLESIGTQAGKALFESAIDDSNIENALRKYDNAVNDMFKQHSGLERYSELYEKAIAEVVKGNKQLADQMNGRSLFDQIDIAGQERLQKAVYSLKNNNNFGLISAANDALSTYFNLQERVKAKWEEITNESIPAMSDELKAAAREIGITKFDQLTSEQKQSLEALTREYVNSIEGGSVEAKNRLAEELASQVFHIKIVGDLTIDSTKMSGFASYIWDKFGGNDQQNKAESINLPMFPWQSTQIGGGEAQKIKVGNMYFTKQQSANIFENIDKFAKDYNSQVDDLEKRIKRYRKAGAHKLAEEAEAERNDLLSVLDALGLREEKTKSKGGSGGSKKDTVLEAAKTRLEEIKDFYSEYEKYRDQYGDKKAVSLVADIFGLDENRARYIVDNYESEIRKIITSIKQDGSEARKRFAINGWKLLGDFNLKEDKEKIRKALEELQRYIQDETSKWNLYKGLLEKTGNKDFAMQAFVDGIQWDDMTRNMSEKLREMLSKGGRNVDMSELFNMDETDAEKFLGKNTEEFKLWQEIVKDIRKNWTDSLNEVANATEKLLTIEEKIAKTEQELAELRRKYGANDPRAIAKERDLGKLQVEAFEQSEPYLKFYSAIFAMAADEAEAVGMSIKENLVKQLAEGKINADKYLKSIKNIDQQLQKMRGVRSDALTLMTGGVRGLLEKRSNVYESKAAAAAIRIQKEQEKIDKERRAIQNAATKEEKEAAQMRLIAAQASKQFAETELLDAQKKLGWTQESLQQANEILAVMELVAGAIDGMKQAAQQLSDMFDALGHEHTANTWSDISDTIGALGSSVSESVNALKSAMSGDVGGAISHTVGIFTSPVTAFAKLHDKKMQRRIEESERKVRSLTTAYQNLQSAMESALGGIYVTGGYDEMFANLQRQRDELAKQYDTESKKKKKDADKLADYEQQISEMDESIKNFALDMAKALYDIDLQGWASQLTEAIVNAWEKGEDAVDAYRSKVKEIMKDLTTNILAKKVMERAFESLGIDDIIAGMMDASSGKLDESMIPKLSEALIKVGDATAGVITGVLDNLEGRGYIEKDSDSASKSSTSTSIKSITEETADLLASYINAIRADVSVNRMTLTEILYAIQGQSEMPVIARAQLQQLEQVAANTRRNADAAEMIYEVLHANVLGANAFKVK